MARIFTTAAPSGYLLRSLGRCFLHARRLPPEVPEEVQLGSADTRPPHDIDPRNRRRMQREDPFHTLTERHLADGKRRARPAAVHADHDPLEDLDALFVTLADLHVDPH